MQEQNKYLIQYTKNRKGQLNGAVVAVGHNQVGYSLTMPVDMHKFTKKMAVEIAANRATKENLQVPHSIRREFNSMVERSKRYFKNN